ncbi:DsbE family thiol:disulfide interchange protein [Sphingorhabdus sp. 109]|jgi:cytochrome c biogenesis protein CcmG/thiol:disulfide interchange protein DsbE|uniref:DsbE family thiol:disulfide interchange protein n=1 Tax=Sphingorhabdus sp. 109 TaxID=2653173 RepID=UPI0012EF1C95|nr:DsbE family thiol:disulfide interchange protein [Sphingorhabdus sp. 109]VWX56560.1 Thiol:disulfide interchange protein DsbE [Sphingorhabdus sp. 109]
MNRWLLWLPLALFGLLFATFATGLILPKDNIIESKMVGKPMPDFALPAAIEQRPGLSSADLAKGKPTLLNIFASWCLPCIAEAPQLLALQQAGVEINAIASRDTPEDIANFLNRWGNPYARIGTDTTSKVQLELGSSGVPETFVIDGNGIIVHQHIGDIRQEDVDMLLKLLEDAE